MAVGFLSHKRRCKRGLTFHPTVQPQNLLQFASGSISLLMPESHLVKGPQEYVIGEGKRLIDKVSYGWTYSAIVHGRSHLLWAL